MPLTQASNVYQQDCVTTLLENKCLFRYTYEKVRGPNKVFSKWIERIHNVE